jgi:phage major head subunit gpT-like protein
MPAITPEFLFDLESNMRLISSNEYQRLGKSLWWDRVARRMESQAKVERINWLLDTAKIERPNASRGGGQAIFEDIVAKTTEFENENAVAGLQLKKEQLEDLDGNGVQLATHWSRQIGAYAAYWPQKMVANAIKANPTTYDGLAFFATNHPVNPFNSGAGTFANRFTGASSGSYPGALPIHEAVTVEVALGNLAKAVAYMAGITMPNGEDPRGLRPVGILVPPALMPRATLLLNAKSIVQSAATGALAGDVEAVISYLGLGQPIQADELGAAFGGSDTTYYILAEEITSNELGAFAYVDREPFSVLYHGPMTDAELARKREFQWTTEGRNTVGAGHPYLLFRCEAT